MVKQNPVIPNIHSGANIIIYTLRVQIVFIILFIVHIFEKHVEMQLVLPAWHGLRTGLTWTVNKQGGKQKRKSPETLQT